MTMKKLSAPESRNLERLLQKTIASGGWWPNERTFQLAHGIISAWAPELVITRRVRGRKEVLLTRYGGGAKKFRGWWHLPGGYDKWTLPDIAADCSAIAKRELGFDVAYRGILGAYKWRPNEHPYGRPLSLYVSCAPKKKIAETAVMRFFPVKRLPPRIVPCHRKFIAEHLADR